MKEEIKLSDHFGYRKLMRFTMPSIVMLIFTSIYGVVDGLFVSNFVGKTSFAAVNLIMPVLMILGCVGFMFGTGGGALIAMSLGEGKKEKASHIFSFIVAFSAICGIVLGLLGIILIRPVAMMLGAEGKLLSDCVLYGRIILAALPFYILQFEFQCLFATAGKPKLGLYVTVAAGVTNMVLDALFVGVFKWGVAGAAIATGLSQCVGGLLPFIYFLRPNNSLLRFVKTKIEFRPVIDASANGASELVSNVTASIVGMLYNYQLLKYAGEDGVAAYGTLMYVEFIFISVFIGYAIGSAPIISYHFGADNHAELKNMLKKSLILMSLAGVAMLIISEALAFPLAHIFVGYDEKLLEMTVHGFRVFSLMFPLASINIFASSFFTALNNGGVSAAISFLRTFVFKLAAVLILPLLFKLDGIWWATIVAELFAFLLSIGFVAAKKKKYGY